VNTNNWTCEWISSDNMIVMHWYEDYKWKRFYWYKKTVPKIKTFFRAIVCLKCKIVNHTKVTFVFNFYDNIEKWQKDTFVDTRMTKSQLLARDIKHFLFTHNDLPQFYTEMWLKLGFSRKQVVSNNYWKNSRLWHVNCCEPWNTKIFLFLFLAQ
jgi:hypothetical protein